MVHGTAAVAGGILGGWLLLWLSGRPARCGTVTDQVTGIRPAADAGAAQWLLRPDVDWWVMVRYGPPGFPVYARIALRADDHDDAGVPPGEPAVDRVRTALEVLASCTATPSQTYVALWEGWVTPPPPAPAAPSVPIPNREMLLFTGPVRALRDAPSVLWYGTADRSAVEPHLVWPADRAWCLACEVDEEIEFSVGCSEDALLALDSAMPGAVRRARYGEQAPVYRSEL